MKKLLFGFIAVLVVMTPTFVAADGCFVWKWNKGVDIHEPSQKAIILYDRGREDLILQVKYEGPIDDFGWLIPVPGKPEVAKASMDSFYELSRTVQMGMNGHMDGRKEKEEGVTVLEHKTVGVYEIATLTASDAVQLKKWLKDNGFSWPDKEDKVLQDYIGKGWYFVATKISIEEAAESGVQAKLRSGELHPLRISFKTKECIYPLKVSSLSGGESMIHIYMISAKHPRISPEMNLPVARLPANFDQYRVTFDANSAIRKDLPRLAGRQWYLVKYSRSFKPKEMNDLTFVPATPVAWTNACEKRLDRWLTTDPNARVKTTRASCRLAVYYAPRAYEKIMEELSAKPDLNQLLWVGDVDWEQTVVPSDGVACLLARVWLDSREERKRLQCGDLLVHMKSKATAGVRLLTAEMTAWKPDQAQNFLFDNTFMAGCLGSILKECPDDESIGKIIQLYRDVRKTICRQSHGHLVSFLAATHSPAVADMIVERFDDAPTTMAGALVTMQDKRAVAAITKAILHEGWFLAGGLFESLVNLDRDAAFKCMVKAIDAEKPGVVAGHDIGKLFRAGLSDEQYEILFQRVFKFGRHPDHDPVFLRYVAHLHAKSIEETDRKKLQSIMEGAVKARALLWASKDSLDTVIGKIAIRLYESKKVEQE